MVVWKADWKAVEMVNCWVVQKVEMMVFLTVAHLAVMLALMLAALKAEQ